MKFLLLFLLLLFCAPSFIYCENRIINGHQTPPGKYMFIPKLISFDGDCSSTIISNRHVLTAAHCVVNFNMFEESTPKSSSPISKQPYYVIDIRPLEELPDIIRSIADLSNFFISSKAYIYRGYSVEYLNDIAIIEFPEGTNFNVTPITLAKDYVDNYDDTVIAAGYGNYIFDAETRTVLDASPPDLRDVKVKVRPITDCYNIEKYDGIKPSNVTFYKYQQSIVNDEKKLLCAGNSGELPQRADHGDSGGPLMYELNGKIYQIGVVSGGMGDIDVEVPDMYTRVSYYCEWIEMVTKGEVKCQSLKKEEEETESVDILPKINLTKMLTMIFKYFWNMCCV